MKSLVACMTVFGVLVSSPVLAKKHHGYQDTYYDYGRVVRVKPVYDKHHHHSHDRHCHSTEKHYNRYRNSHHHNRARHSRSGHNTVASTMTGAVVGGVIGNVIGSNSKHRKMTTAAGAVIGGAIGHEIAKNDHSRSHHNHGNNRHSHYDVQCSSSHEYGNNGRRIKGYKVTYRYKGETLKTFTRHDPGSRIKVQVQVTPAVYN